MEKKERYCIVPHCQSSTVKTPKKIFTSLPTGLRDSTTKRRTLWLQAMGKKETDVSEKTRAFVCEDHFNLEEDMKNYIKFKLMGGNVYLKDHVVPHIFKCQTAIKRHLSPEHRTAPIRSPRTSREETLLKETSRDEQYKQKPDQQYAVKKYIKYSRYCLVPHCQSSTIKTPEKIFASFPVGSSDKLIQRRKLWLRAMNRNESDISENTRGFVCEDHFNLEEDMKNYMKFKLMGGNVFLKDHVVPHIFKCQTDIVSNLPPESAKRPRTSVEGALLNTTTKHEYEQCDDQAQDKSTQLPLTPTVHNKSIQTDYVCKRTVSVQWRHPYRSKYVQTDIVYGLLTAPIADLPNSKDVKC